MEVFKGPLGSHRNYITYIALDNVTDYSKITGLNKEEGRDKTPDKYKEFRYFLSAIESLNNILDYYYYENETHLSHKTLFHFKEAAHTLYPVLKDVADIANAYKHCVREHRQIKNMDKLWAKDLQQPKLSVSINTPDDVKVHYTFEWPIQSNDTVLMEAFKFWVDYINPGSLVDFKSM